LTPARAEARLYAHGKHAGAFQAGARMPRAKENLLGHDPAAHNVTGSRCNMGHAFNNTLADILGGAGNRNARVRHAVGSPVPGPTRVLRPSEVVVNASLPKDGKRRTDFHREEIHR